MASRTLDELALDLKQRRLAGDLPMTLLLGAGASVEAGIGAMPQLYKLAGVADFKEFSQYISGRTEAERFRFLMSFLQILRPEDVTPGYRALAALCEEGFFDVILTTNLDPLLDDALASARLWRKDYLLLVNGVLRGDRLLPLLRAAVPRVKVLKLHGDLFHRFMAWTEKEMDQFLIELNPALNQALEGRDLMVVGHSLRDVRIAQIALDTLAGDGVVWFTHPARRTEALPVHDRLREVIDPACAFESMFTTLARKLDVKVEGKTPSPLGERTLIRSPQPLDDSSRVQTSDDLWSAVVGVGDYLGQAQATGVLIAEPRGILCDRFSLDRYKVGEKVPVRTRNGERWECALLRKLGDSPFGPMLLDAPESWAAHAVAVDTGALSPGEMMRVAVFAGDRPGMSTGAVADTSITTHIDPVGEVRDLVGLRVAVAPGSSGAPVVDEALRLRGFIVAGSTDLQNPWSLMDPASRWHSAFGDPVPRKGRKKP